MRTLLADPGAIRWDYERAEWLRHLDAEASRPYPVPWILGGVFGTAGAVAAGLYAAEAGASGGAWLLVGGGGLLLGALAGGTAACLRRSGLSRRREAAGIFCAGESGVYVTGVFWPWSGAGFGFRECLLEPGPPPRLLFRYSMPRSGLSELRVPVPAGRLEEARSLAGRIAPR